MANVMEVSSTSFDMDVKAADKPVVVEFWIRSCGYCQKYKPIYKTLPEIFGDKITFLEMNMFQSLENLKLAEGFGVEETPTLKFFCKAKEIGEIVGFRPLNKVIEEIEKILKRKEYCNKQNSI